MLSAFGGSVTISFYLTNGIMSAATRARISRLNFGVRDRLLGVPTGQQQINLRFRFIGGRTAALSDFVTCGPAYPLPNYAGIKPQNGAQSIFLSAGEPP